MLDLRLRTRAPQLVFPDGVACLSTAALLQRLPVHGGFRALRHGVVVRDEAGGWSAEPDLADDVARVAVQHDGAVHFEEGVERWRHDLQRDELTRQADGQVVVATALDDRRPDLLVAKVTAAYRRAARTWGAQVLPMHLR